MFMGDALQLGSLSLTLLIQGRRSVLLNFLSEIGSPRYLNGKVVVVQDKEDSINALSDSSH